VIGDAAQGHRGHEYAGILVVQALVLDRQYHMRYLRAASQEDRAHRASIAQNHLDGNMPGETGHVLGRYDFMGAEGIVPGRDQLDGRLNHRLALGVEQGHHAEIVALVVHQLEKLAQDIGSRQRAADAGQIENARLDRQRGLQVRQVAADVLRNLARQQNFVAFNGRAQGSLANPDRRIAGNGQRHGGHADGEEGKLGQQLHGTIQEKPLGRLVQPLLTSKAQTVACPLELGTTPRISSSLCHDVLARGRAPARV